MSPIPYQLIPKLLETIEALQPKHLLVITPGDDFFTSVVKTYLSLPMTTLSIARADQTHPPADLVLLIDTAEHVTKRELKKALPLLLQKHRGVLLTASRDGWDKSEFASLGKAMFVHDPERIIAYLSSSSNAIAPTRRRRVAKKVLRTAKQSKVLTKIVSKIKRKSS